MAPDRRTLDIRAASAALADGSPEQVTMAGVARALGVAKPTLYRLARSRAELIDACVETEGERLVEQLHAAFVAEGGLERSPGARVDHALERFAADSPGGFALLFGAVHPQARAAVRRAEDRLRDLLRRAGEAPSPGVAGQHQRRTASGAPPPRAADAAALLGAAVARLRRRGEDEVAAAGRP
ncbi:MAG: TetR/AcrR family transcriptional regulator [Actinomycetota bacterium]|nr:TetR/AcrR family transcriptional regulator [Actinomycetota bacterium]